MKWIQTPCVARTLGVDKITVGRWYKEGRLPPRIKRQGRRGFWYNKDAILALDALRRSGEPIKLPLIGCCGIVTWWAYAKHVGIKAVRFHA